MSQREGKKGPGDKLPAKLCGRVASDLNVEAHVRRQLQALKVRIAKQRLNKSACYQATTARFLN